MEAQKPRSCLSDAFKAVRAREGSISASTPRAVPEPIRRCVPPAAATRCYTFSGYVQKQKMADKSSKRSRLRG